MPNDLHYSEINTPKIVTPEPEPEPEYKPPFNFSECVYDTVYNTALITVMIIGLPIIGIVYAIDFIFYESFGGKIRPCFRCCFRNRT